MILESLNVEKSFGKKEVLKGLTFSAGPGEITFLAGKNGAGKTTWLRIAIGLIQSSSGSVLLEGKKADSIRSKLAIVFDEPPIYPNMNGHNNLSMLSGGIRPEPEWRARVLANLSIDEGFLKLRASKYSMGQRHRLAVAAALLRRPTFLFLDEPAAGLDPCSWGLVKDCLKELAASGSCIILTGQDFGLMEPLCNRVVIMKDGTAALTGTIQTALEHFPPCVQVRASDLAPVANMFDAPITNDHYGPLCRIPCASKIEAEKVVFQVKQLELSLHELVIRINTLEETFNQLIGV